jgi:hypothetical protein
MTYIEELQDVIRHLHGGEATHVESVPVKEVFQGRTIWEGIVEVFELRGHGRTKQKIQSGPSDTWPFYTFIPLRRH